MVLHPSRRPQPLVLSLPAPLAGHLLSCLRCCLFPFSAARRSPLVRGSLASLLFFSIEPVGLTAFHFVSRVSTFQDSLTRRCPVQVGECLWCLSSVCGLWKWTWLPECPVVLLCQYHVSCVRIVGMSSFFIPLVVFDTQRCVSCLQGQRMPHILRSCSAHPRII